MRSGGIAGIGRNSRIRRSQRAEPLVPRKDSADEKAAAFVGTGRIIIKTVSKAPPKHPEKPGSITEKLRAAIKDGSIDKDLLRNLIKRVEFKVIEPAVEPNKAALVRYAPFPPAELEDLARALETAPEAVNVPADTTQAAQMQDKSIITRSGVKYVPLPLAAWLAQASESTVRNWIDERVKFDGRAIETHVSLTNGLYVSEDSVKRMAERFIKWPSGKPLGKIRLGETDDRTGYIGTPDAARIVGVSSRTMWLWASQGKAPTNKSLDVIKCTTSDHFYIREKDVFELNALVPRTGLQRGRRPKSAAQPS